MASLEILKYPDPRLKEVAAAVDQFDAKLHKFLDDMRDTMYLADGIGLASTQVGEMIRAVVIDVTREEGGCMDLINPEIIHAEGKATSEEGCLSIPGYRDTIKRSAVVRVKALDRFGKPVEFEADGLLAFCVQHEIDHLNGILFVDHLSRLKREIFRRWLKKQHDGE